MVGVFPVIGLVSVLGLSWPACFWDYGPMTAGKHLTLETKRLIYKRWKEGASCQDLARRFELHVKSIQRIVKRERDKDGTLTREQLDERH